MKYILSFLLLFVFALSSCARSKPEIPTPLVKYPESIGVVDLATGDAVVMIGDSLTDLGYWNDLFPGVKMANQGIGGNTTFQVLARLQPIIDAAPPKIFLLIGANDYNFGTAMPIITKNHEEIIDRIIKGSPRTKLYVQLIFPFGENVREYFPQIPKTYKEDIKLMNLSLIKICEQRNVTWLNTYELMSDGHDNLKAEYTKDRIHLEEPGYTAWAKFLKPYVVK